MEQLTSHINERSRAFQDTLGCDDANRSLPGQRGVCLLHHSMPTLSMVPGTSEESSKYVLNNTWLVFNLVHISQILFQELYSFLGGIRSHRGRNFKTCHFQILIIVESGFNKNKTKVLWMCLNFLLKRYSGWSVLQSSVEESTTGPIPKLCSTAVELPGRHISSWLSSPSLHL